MRYNLLQEIHMPLRVALISASISLNTDEMTEPSTALKKVSHVVHLINQQVATEEQFILPLIFEFEPSVWDMYTRQHHQTKNTLRELNSLLKSFEKATDEDDQWFVIKMIKDTFMYMMMTSYHHMDEEEEVLNEILWRYYSDKVLVQLRDDLQLLPTMPQHKQRANMVQAAYAA